MTTLIDRYIAEQQDLTAVERFSQRHAADAASRQERYYRDLIPLELPGPGEQYGFEVDLDACTGCKACVTACRSLNGLDADESWRSVGTLHGRNGRPHLQTVTTTCHHCADPACLKGCPVGAYDKDPATGIVKHLDDQCIGCGYCMWTCPYEVPLYNDRLGIVRKCDMCSDRLAEGEAPACVQACPNAAIRISIVDPAEPHGGTLVPGAPPSAITKPATRYRTKHSQDHLVAVDHYALRPAHAHPPLAVMLVLTQLSVGAFVVDLAMRSFAHGAARPFTAVVALGLAMLALGASVLHLGRPRYAYRAPLGIRTSWLSREIVAFGAFASLATVYAGMLLVFPKTVSLVLGGLVAVAGLAAVGCSAMVYAVTSRRWWQARFTFPRFMLTAATCGLATVLCTTIVSTHVLGAARPLAVALGASMALKLAWEASFFRHLLAREATDLKRTAALLTRDLGGITVWRYVLGLLGGIAMPVIVLVSASTVVCALASALGLLAVVGGELIERSQFFRAVVSPRMPGGLP